MGLILICGNRFSREQELAQSLAEHLAYRLITPEVVIERAVVRGGSRQKLMRILAGPPRLFDRLLRHTRRQWLFLRAALAEEIRSGNAVCYRELADLLQRDDLPAVRIGIVSSRESRIGVVEWSHHLDGAAAVAVLKQADRARKAWLQLMYGNEGTKAIPDLVFNLDRLGLPEVGDTIAAHVRRLEEAGRTTNLALLEDLLVSTKVDEALATNPATDYLELLVESNRGRVSIRGRMREPEDTLEVERIARSIAGVSQIVLNGEVMEERQVTSATARGRRLLPLGAPQRYVALGLTVVTLLIISGLAGKFGSFVERATFAKWAQRPETITGMITDSRCGIRHLQAESAQCVRACVARGARYVLDDGRNLYELSDEHGAERFASREVRVKGLLGKDSRNLKIVSIDPL